MFKPTIGLEIHVQLSTKSKMFCSCSTEFGDAPNSHICPVCLGLPGSLPVINGRAVELAVTLAHALNLHINLTSTFYRKNYFYPDLTKGYQITQYSLPLGYDGFLEIPLEGKIKKVGIERAHIEEDSGKSIHIGDITESEFSLVDFNRAGVPLVEVVTRPDLESGDEAYEFLVLLRSIVRYLGVSSGDMEKGALSLISDQIITPTYIDDIVNGIEFLIRKNTKSDIFHLVGFCFLKCKRLYKIRNYSTVSGL